MENHLEQADAMLPGLEGFFSSDSVCGAFYAGAGFPDWGYFLEFNRQASENCHWPAFHTEHLKFLLKNCPSPWDEATACRIAFFFGTVSHYALDGPWHFSGECEQSVSNLSRLYDGPNSERFETYTEILAFRDLEMDEVMRQEQFFWPVEDLTKVYKKRNLTVSAEGLQTGINVLISQWRLAQFASLFKYQSSRRAIPWSSAHYVDYCYGGIDNSAALTAMLVRRYYAQLNGGDVLQNYPVCGHSAAQGFHYAGCTDTSMRAACPQSNTGAEPFLLIGSKENWSTLIRFGLPDTLKANTAALWLYCEDSSEKPTNEVELVVTPLEQTWTEGDGTLTDSDGVNGKTPKDDRGVTWQHYQKLRRGKPLFMKVRPQDGRWFLLDITPFVQHWIESPSSNHGLAIHIASDTDMSIRCYSSEALRSQPDGYGGGRRVSRRPLLILMP